MKHKKLTLLLIPIVFLLTSHTWREIKKYLLYVSHMFFFIHFVNSSRKSITLTVTTDYSLLALFALISIISMRETSSIFSALISLPYSFISIYKSHLKQIGIKLLNLCFIPRLSSVCML